MNLVLLLPLLLLVSYPCFSFELSFVNISRLAYETYHTSSFKEGQFFVGNYKLIHHLDATKHAEEFFSSPIADIFMKNYNEIVISFRGSDTALDWNVNLFGVEPRPVPFLSHSKAHGGIVEELTHLTEIGLLQKLETLLQQYCTEQSRGCTITCTGHSQGSAQAILIAPGLLETIKHYKIHFPIKIFSIATPPIVDDAFIKWTKLQSNKLEIYNFHHCLDVIHLVGLLGWKYVGKQIISYPLCESILDCHSMELYLKSIQQEGIKLQKSSCWSSECKETFDKSLSLLQYPEEMSTWQSMTCRMVRSQMFKVVTKENACNVINWIKPFVPELDQICSSPTAQQLKF